MTAPRILDVGQCMVDGPRMSRFLKESLHAHVDTADTLDQAVAQANAHRYGLVLVNRLLNADSSPGLAVVSAICAAHPKLPVMLVSDYDNAQADAVSAGALRGFGKSMLDEPSTLELLRKTLEHPTHS